MSVKDIASLPVYKLANDNSVLCMWATMPLLPEAFFVIKSWGFKYKTCLITWVKTYPKKTDKYVLGMGSYSRSNIEICLLATKGK
jgi:N6-adenosine-specific RNA methylase IME4